MQDVAAFPASDLHPNRWAKVTSNLSALGKDLHLAVRRDPMQKDRGLSTFPSRGGSGHKAHNRCECQSRGRCLCWQCDLRNRKKNRK